LTDSCRVIANFGDAVAVLSQSRQVHRALPLQKLPLLVAGDRVICEQYDQTSYRVLELVQRDGVLSRKDRRGHDKAMAANVSHLAIVCAPKPGIETLLIDQFCVAAERAGIGAIIVINKTDLLLKDERETSERMAVAYRQAGYPVVFVDTKNPDKLAPFIDELNGKTVVLVGASGVGKSSIVQKLLPDQSIRIGAVSKATGLGAHTTTVTFWYELDNGAAIIDSPGVRQFSVSHLSPSDVRQGFRDIAGLANTCRFSDCSHVVEPACAVVDAVKQGTLAEWRYQNYRKLANV